MNSWVSFCVGRTCSQGCYFLSIFGFWIQEKLITLNLKFCHVLVTGGRGPIEGSDAMEKVTSTLKKAPTIRSTLPEQRRGIAFNPRGFSRETEGYNRGEREREGGRMGRSPCCSKEGLNRGAWTVVEDRILTEYIKVHGEGKWRNLPKKAGGGV